jgi:hypothetical protein
MPISSPPVTSQEAKRPERGESPDARRGADAIGAGTIVVALREFDSVISRPEKQSLA